MLSRNLPQFHRLAVRAAPNTAYLLLNNQCRASYSKKYSNLNDSFEYDDLIEEFTQSGDLELKLDLSTDIDFIRGFEGLNDEMDRNIRILLEKCSNQHVQLLDKQKAVFEFLVYVFQFEVMCIENNQRDYPQFVFGLLERNKTEIKSSELLSYLKEAEGDEGLVGCSFFAKKMVDYLGNLCKKQKESADFMFLYKNKYELASLLALLEALEIGLDYAPGLKNRGLYYLFELLFSYTNQNGEKLVVDCITKLKYLETLKYLKKDQELIRYLESTKETLDQKWWYEKYLQELLNVQENKAESMDLFEAEFRKHLERFSGRENVKIPLLFFSSALARTLKEKRYRDFDYFMSQLENMLARIPKFAFTAAASRPEYVPAFETEREFFDYFNNNVEITLSDYIICISETLKADPENVTVLKRMVRVLEQFRGNDAASDSAAANLDLLVRMNEHLRDVLNNKHGESLNNEHSKTLDNQHSKSLNTQHSKSFNAERGTSLNAEHSTSFNTEAGTVLNSKHSTALNNYSKPLNTEFGTAFNNGHGTALNNDPGTPLNSQSGASFNTSNSASLNSDSGESLNSDSGTSLNSKPGTSLNSKHSTSLNSKPGTSFKTATTSQLLETLEQVSSALSAPQNTAEPHSFRLLKGYFITNCMELLRNNTCSKEIDALLVRVLETSK